MKTLVFTLLLTATIQAWGTSDAWDKVYLVVRDQGEGELMIERFSMVGCFGPMWGPKLTSFTSEFKVPMSIGCGSQPIQENVNELVCAKTIEQKESKDFSTLDYVKLDLSKCSDTSETFKKIIVKAAKMNFGKQLKVEFQ